MIVFETTSDKGILLLERDKKEIISLHLSENESGVLNITEWRYPISTPVGEAEQISPPQLLEILVKWGWVERQHFSTIKLVGVPYSLAEGLGGLFESLGKWNPKTN